MTTRNDIRIYEIGLRSLCVLARFAESGLTLDEMVSIDFQITYDNTLGLPNDNLNGCSNFRESETAARRQRMKAALAAFSSRGFVACASTSSGIAFLPTPLGIEIVNSLHGDYANLIRENIDCYLRQLGSKDLANKQDINK